MPVSDAPAAGRLQDRVYTVIDSAGHLLRHCLHSHIESSALFSSRLTAVKAVVGIAVEVVVESGRYGGSGEDPQQGEERDTAQCLP